MSALTIEEYFGPWINTADATTCVKEDAEELVSAVNNMIGIAASDGVEFSINPSTKSIVSGQIYGGFRPQSCTQGAKNSSHKQGMAVDLYDPEGKIDEWCMSNQDALKKCGIYIEHPDYTQGWSHWSIKAPKSGHTVFIP